MQSKRISHGWAMGLTTEHKNAVADHQELVKLPLVRRAHRPAGSRAVSSARPFQCEGRRTMGIWERMNDSFMEKLGRGVSVCAAARSTAPTRWKRSSRCRTARFVSSSAWGALLAASPDTEYTAKALRNAA